MKKNGLMQKIFVFLIFIFLYVPIIFMIIYSFNASKTFGYWTGFTLDWYKELLVNETIQQSVLFTFIIAILATFFAVILGTFFAIGIYYTKKRTRNLYLIFNQIPLNSPDIIIGISFMLIFLFLRVPFGWQTILLAHIMFCTPVVLVSIMPRLYMMDNALVEAAEDLGANEWQMLKVAILPSILPGIFTGAMLSFTFSLDDFVVTYFTAGEGVTTLSLEIFTQIRRQINPSINALSTILFLSIFLLIIAYWLISKRKGELPK